MYVFKADAQKLIDDLKLGIHDEVRRVSDVMLSLLDEDDWAFVIKSQALVEATMTGVVVASLDREELRRLVERLPLADEQFGKLNFAKELGLIAPAHRRYIKRLSALRNKLAHSLACLEFSFEEYFGGLEKSELRAWRDATLWFMDEGDARDNWVVIFSKFPKIALWMSSYLVVAEMALTEVECRGTNKLDKLASDTARKLLEKSGDE